MYYSIGQIDFSKSGFDLLKVGSGLTTERWQTDIAKTSAKYGSFALEEQAKLDHLNEKEKELARIDIAKINSELLGELTIEESRQRYKMAATLGTFIIIESALLGLFYYLKRS